MISQLAMYPDIPGYKEPTTSKEAAQEMASSAKLLRVKCLDMIRKHPMTADQVAAILDLSVLSVRPRISELYAKGLIEKTKMRGRNASGKRATVWRAKNES